MPNPYEQYVPDKPANPYEQYKPAPAAPRGGFPEVEIGGDGRPTRLTVRPPGAETPYVDQGPKQADIGVSGGLAVGAINSATANFADELAGAFAAGTPSAPVEREGPGSILGGIARLAYEHFTGQPGEATAAYEAARNKWRDTTALAEEQHPTATLAGNVAGGVAIPGMAAVRGAGIGARVLAGAKTGGIVGGLSGVGEGENLADRAVKGATGATIGSAVGAAAVPLGEAVTRGANAAWRYGSGLYRGIMQPGEEAQRRGAQVLLDAQQRGGNDVIPIGHMTGLQAEGQPVANLDIAGQGGRILARSVRNTPGANQGTAALQGMVGDRFKSQAERTAAWLDRHTPWKNGVDFERILEANRSSNAPAYARAYAEGRAAFGRGASYNPDAFMTKELKDIAGAPDVVRAFGQVDRKLGNQSIIEGQSSPRRSPFARNENGRLTAREFPSGNSTATPDLEAWDQVQRVLGARAREAAARPGGADEARQLNLLRDRLNTELDRIVPSFEAARGTAWRGFRADNAYDAGMNYVGSTAIGREAQALQRHIANMTPIEKNLFAAGFAQSLIARVKGTNDSANIVNRIYNSPTARDRIKESLGPRLAREMEAYLHVETVMNYGKNEVSGGSHTVQQLLAAGLAGGFGYSAVTGNLDASSFIAAGAAAGGRRLMAGSQARLADQIGLLLASNDPRMFATGIAVLSRSNDLLQNLRSAVDRIASRVPSQQAAGSAGEAARGIVRSYGDSEPVPGPVN